MSGIKYYQRVQYLIELIEKRKTGTPGELAEKLNVTERTVYNIMGSMRVANDRGIRYSKEDRSYVFEQV